MLTTHPHYSVSAHARAHAHTDEWGTVVSVVSVVSVAAALASALPSERAVLSALDACGPLRAGAVAEVTRLQFTVALETLMRLRDVDLVGFSHHYWHLAPRVVRWLRELERAPVSVSRRGVTRTNAGGSGSRWQAWDAHPDTPEVRP